MGLRKPDRQVTAISSPMPRRCAPRPRASWPGIGGRLWWHVGDAGVIVVDPATGAAHEAIDFEPLNRQRSVHRKYPPAATWQHVRGQDIGILPGGWVVLGGRQFNLPLNNLGQPGNEAVFLRAEPGGALQDDVGYWPIGIECTAAGLSNNSSFITFSAASKSWYSIE